eukprot:PLAT11098.1.p1 GENE.PLAT11098.1~~PLAT11098.1.p1  ORF type:complete len:680 (-),score=216.42 PLAT11098.1:91-2106(-)
MRAKVVALSPRDSASVAVEDTAKLDAELSSIGHPRVPIGLHLKRAFNHEFESIQATDSEVAKLSELADVAPLGKRFLLWRRSVMLVATLALLFSVTGRSVSLYEEWVSSSTALRGILPEQYAYLFDPLIFTTRVMNTLYVVSMFVAYILLIAAACWWKQYHRSRLLVAAAFLINLLIPYVLYLVVPYKETVDIDAAVRVLCEDVVGGISSAGEGLRQELLTFNITLDASFCAEPVTTWPTLLDNKLQERGLIVDHNGTCPFSREAAGLTADYRGISTACRPCLTCFDQSCLSALALQGMNLTELVSDACAPCLQPDAQQQTCYTRCATEFTPFLTAAVTSPSLCVNASTLESVQGVATLASVVTDFDLAIGFYMAYNALRLLLPTALSLQTGALRAGKHVRELIPSSRIPGWLIVGITIFCLPLLSAFLSVWFQALGDYFLMVSILCIVMNYGMYLVGANTLTQPHSLAFGHQTTKLLSRVSKLWYLIAFIFLLLWIGNSTLLTLVASNAVAATALETIFDLLFSSIFDFLGKTQVTSLFFADSFVYLILVLRVRDSTDPEPLRAQRQKTLMQLLTLEPKLSEKIDRETGTSLRSVLQVQCKTLKAARQLLEARAREKLADKEKPEVLARALDLLADSGLVKAGEALRRRVRRSLGEAGGKEDGEGKEEEG